MARQLTKEELDDARRLKQLWIARKDQLHLSQVKAAKELGYNSQGAISQYINGRVSLNFQSDAKFAKLLRVEIKDISPRFAPLVGKPVPTSLDGFNAPVVGNLGGIDSTNTLDWFATHRRSRYPCLLTSGVAVMQHTANYLLICIACANDLL